METTASNPVRYLRIVTFAFEVGGDDTLAGYRQEGDDGAIFVPFRDKTTGQQTYHNGRYMELEPDGELADGDAVTIDFNLAYCPFCAYSETFSCPARPKRTGLDRRPPRGEDARQIVTGGQWWPATAPRQSRPRTTPNRSIDRPHTRCVRLSDGLRGVTGSIARRVDSSISTR